MNLRVQSCSKIGKDLTKINENAIKTALENGAGEILLINNVRKFIGTI